MQRSPRDSLREEEKREGDVPHPRCPPCALFGASSHFFATFSRVSEAFASSICSVETSHGAWGLPNLERALLHQIAGKTSEAVANGSTLSDASACCMLVAQSGLSMRSFEQVRIHLAGKKEGVVDLSGSENAQRRAASKAASIFGVEVQKSEMVVSAHENKRYRQQLGVVGKAVDSSLVDHHLVTFYGEATVEE